VLAVLESFGNFIKQGVSFLFCRQIFRGCRSPFKNKHKCKSQMQVQAAAAEYSKQKRPHQGLMRAFWLLNLEPE
jgi:hypothetical protein